MVHGSIDSHGLPRDKNPHILIINLRIIKRLGDYSPCPTFRGYPELSSRPFLSFQSGTVKRLIPLLDRILVQRAEAATKTKGGIVIPEKAQQKVQQATVVAVGPGARNKDGDVIPMSIAVGDKVLLPEYGGTKVSCEDSVIVHFVV